MFEVFTVRSYLDSENGHCQQKRILLNTPVIAFRGQGRALKNNCQENITWEKWSKRIILESSQ
jgi:hypothetical protein